MGEDEKKPSSSGNGYYKKNKWNNNKKKQHVSNPTVRVEKFKGGKEELDGNHFDCTGYGQSDRFVKTVQKIADYVGQEYKCGGISRTEVVTQGVYLIPMPPRPVGTTVTVDGVITTTPPDALDISDYQSAKKTVDYQIQNQLENRQKLFSLVWQQCTEPMQAKIKAHRDYQSIEQTLNGIELLRIIKLICFNIEDEKYVPQKVHETKAAFYHLKQGKDSDQAYQIRFMNTVQVIEQCGASLGEDPLTRIMVCKDLNYSINTQNVAEIAEISSTVRDYTLGAALILGADPARYSGMIRELKNASLSGRDEWPKNMTEAYNYLSKWEGDEPVGKHDRDYEGSSFLNDEEKDKEPKKEYKKVPLPWHVNMTCRNCLQKGHIAAFCGDTKTAATNVQDGQATHEEAAQQLLDGSDDEDYYADLFLCEDQEHRSVSFQLKDGIKDGSVSKYSDGQDHSSMSFQLKDGINGGRIPKYWVLIDSQSTTDAYSNPDLLDDIHEVRGSLTIHTQTGKAVTKLKGTLPGYGLVWFCPGGIANILSLANVAKRMEVKFDSTNGNQFEVTKKDGSKRVFKQSEHGLYYYDMRSN
jgi:hypothetical protein